MVITTIPSVFLLPWVCVCWRCGHGTHFVSPLSAWLQCSIYPLGSIHSFLDNWFNQQSRLNLLAAKNCVLYVFVFMLLFSHACFLTLSLRVNMFFHLPPCLLFTLQAHSQPCLHPCSSSSCCPLLLFAGPVIKARHSLLQWPEFDPWSSFFHSAASACQISTPLPLSTPNSKHSSPYFIPVSVF